MHHLNTIALPATAVALLVGIAIQDRPTQKAGRLSPEPTDLAQYEKSTAEWQDEIRKLEQLEPKGSSNTIVCFGSSSIRKWDTIDDDMNPWTMLRRGYGGAKFSDLAILIDRLLVGLEFRAAMIYVGNDIKGDDEDKSPEEIARLARIVIEKIRTAQPRAKIFLIAITPAPKRFSAWSRIQDANSALSSLADEKEETYFIPTADLFLEPDGNPGEKWFDSDRLHLSRAGYQRWAGALKAKLQSVFESK